MLQILRRLRRLRSQIKNIQLSTILILKFAQLFKGTTPQNHPSALCPSINRRLRRLDHNHISHRKRKQRNKRKNNKSEKRYTYRMLLKLYQIACRVSSLNFHKFFGEWLFELPPQISSSLYLSSGFAGCPQFSDTSRLGSVFVLNSPLRNFDLFAPLKIAWHLQFQNFSVVIPLTPVRLMGSEDDGRVGG